MVGAMGLEFAAPCVWKLTSWTSRGMWNSYLSSRHYEPRSLNTPMPLVERKIIQLPMHCTVFRSCIASYLGSHTFFRPKYTNPSIQTSIHPRWRVRNTVQYTTSTAEGKHESHIPHHGVRKLQHVRNYRADSAFRHDNLLIWCRSWTAADMFCDILDQNLFQWQHVCFFLKKSLSSFLFGLTWELLCESGSAYESIIH